MSQPLGLIGLGGMGHALAGNFLSDGHSLRVYNRTADKAKDLVSRGATAVTSPADVAVPGGIVFSIVADDRALEDVTLTSPSLAEKLSPQGVHVSMSTIAPATAKKLSEQHAKHNVAYLSCPVFGRPAAVAARQIFICLSGDPAAKKRIRPIIEKLGQGVFDFADDPTAANVVKLAGNFLITAAMEALSEAAVLVEKSGIRRDSFINFMTASYFNCAAYKNYGSKLIDASYDNVGFKLPLGLKDMNLAMQTAGAVNAPLPLLSLMRDRYLAAISKGRANLDWSALMLGARDDAGLE